MKHIARKRQQFAIGILAGISFIALLGHGIASVLQSSGDGLAEIQIAHLSEAEVLPASASINALPMVTGLTAVDEYARARGYHDWNHYLEHRPRNKMGEREEEGSTALPRVVHATYESPQPAMQDATMATIAHPLPHQTPIIDPADDDSEVTPPPSRHDAFPRGGGYCCVTDTHKPIASVPEPSSLWLIAAGAAALITRRRAGGVA